jgi:probable HAF family extracellular repeat protein
MIDLGHLGGSGVLEDGDANAINNWGQVVGESDTGSAGNHAFLWTPSTPNGTSGTMIDLGFMAGGSGDSEAEAINTARQVVGGTSLPNGGLHHAFLWTPTTPNGTTGTMLDRNTLIGSSTVSLQAATGINDRGQIVGYGTFKSDGSAHAFLLTPTTTTLLAQPASSTPTTSTASPTVAPGGDPSVAAILANPPSGSSGFGPAAASVSFWLSQPAAAPASVTSPAVPVAEALPLVPSPAGGRPPADQADSFPPAVAPEAVAADPVVAGLDAEASLAPFVEDPALTPRN